MPATNPLFDDTDKPRRQGSEVNSQEAVDMIRAKINDLYTSEPNAKEEAKEAELARPRSKHQAYMHKLTTSGQSLADIQTAWHKYYVELPDKEKHEVWQEFYQNHAKLSKFAQKTGSVLPGTPVHHTTSKPTVQHAPHHPRAASHANTQRPANMQELKNQLLSKVRTRAKVTSKHKHQLKSLAFGLSMGVITLVILLFGFFNERFIAPFITPSRTVSSTPIITDINTTQAIPPNSVIIVPKINIEIPVVYDEPSIDEGAVQRALERGVLHYPTTASPGEQGNTVLFGHSSSNILNNGKYKFAFVLLNRLENGDTVMVQKDSKRYVYRVFEKKIVPPTDLSVLADRDRPMVTLITCDPPGTATNRLIVVAEQISPEPASNVASTATAGQVATPSILPSNAPSLWSRLWSWISS